jgi:hypothetical protein
MPDLAAGVGITLAKEPTTNLLRIGTSVVSGRLAFATYAELAAVTDQAKGTPAEVPTSDVGTHTDPVVGGTVDNSGVFRWSDSPAGWERIADVDALSAEPFATAAAISEANAAASAVEATALAHFMPTGTLATIDGVEPLGLIALRDDAGVLRSYMAFMPGAPWIISEPIQEMIAAKLAGVTFKSVTAPGWGSYVFAQRGSDGLLYAIKGQKADGSSYTGNQPNAYAYLQGAALPTADVPNYSATGWNGFLVYSQSLGMGEGLAGQPSVSLTPSTYDLTFGSGLRSGKPGNTAGAVNTSPGTSSTKALVEQDDAIASDGNAAGETPCSGAAAAANRFAARDNGINPAAFVKFCSAAGHGAYSISDLGGPWYANFTDHVSEAKARATAAGKGYVLPAVLWMQGENNAGAGTSRASYLASLTALRSRMNTDVLALTSQSAPVHLLTYQTASNPSTTLANLNPIQLAQMDAINQDPHIHFVGPVYHLPHGRGVFSDGTHLAAIGYRWFGEYAGRAYKQLVIDGRVPDCVWPVSATVNGTTLRVKFRVPQRPLVFDQTTIQLTQDYGFKVTDDTGTLTLSDIKIINGDTVQMTLNRTLSTTPKVRYAMDYLATGLNLQAGASGNLRDSTADTFTFSGATYSLAHWSPHFELSALSVEF